jgi:hypothetical protein
LVLIRRLFNIMILHGVVVSWWGRLILHAAVCFWYC